MQTLRQSGKTEGRGGIIRSTAKRRKAILGEFTKKGEVDGKNFFSVSRIAQERGASDLGHEYFIWINIILF